MEMELWSRHRKQLYHTVKQARKFVHSTHASSSKPKSMTRIDTKLIEEQQQNRPDQTKKLTINFKNS